MQREFHISDILSVVTGRTITENGMRGAISLVSHIVGYEVSSLDLFEAMESAKEFLNKTLPWTKDIVFPTIPEGASKKDAANIISKFITDAAEKYGTHQLIGQEKDTPDAMVAAGSEQPVRIGRNGSGRVL